MAELGGQPLSGIGFGLGVDRTLLAAQAEGLPVGEQSRCDVYGIPLGAASRALVGVAGRAAPSGVRVDLAYGGRALKRAMKAADAAGARVARVLGDRELAVGEVMVKQLDGGDQSAAPLDGAVEAVLGLLSDMVGSSATG